ncbi:protein translocase SEC61 complex subunit gamma [Halalkalicoccus jeotgali]|uniref:Protein translocase subunit SecE n=1 Tax=Halalkalicoccus jeotgali (strain DSM 18796 / CECT 7217 / JCM 14584 / KCTC 4019 / B3) TaxID=795797 RepID=D8J6V6_HALJB|nr:protein translocase SEC61 complex subunit gamma [Halalkalicoccus jeotgali]ADJ15909.1 preprotein translocase Sec61 gamma subunit [Halalkalicoccus jeotgali B3]ELY38005.1 preprotein translocase subunit SecE [Halalkalicoccus jeotgali B3]
MNVPTDLNSYVRVLKFATTPAWEEFSRVALIAAVGIVLVGLIGFFMFVVMSFLPGGL